VTIIGAYVLEYAAGDISRAQELAQQAGVLEHVCVSSRDGMVFGRTALARTDHFEAVGDHQAITRLRDFLTRNKVPCQAGNDLR
jgi:hypothetical protein